jgi:hypothetical protein
VPQTVPPTAVTTSKFGPVADNLVLVVDLRKVASGGIIATPPKTASADFNVKFMIGAPYFLRAAFTDIRLLLVHLPAASLCLAQTFANNSPAAAGGHAARTNKYLEIITYSCVISKLA